MESLNTCSYCVYDSKKGIDLLIFSCQNSCLDSKNYCRFHLLPVPTYSEMIYNQKDDSFKVNKIDDPNYFSDLKKWCLDTLDDIHQAEDHLRERTSSVDSAATEPWEDGVPPKDGVKQELKPDLEKKPEPDLKQEPKTVKTCNHTFTKGVKKGQCCGKKLQVCNKTGFCSAHKPK